LDYNFKWTENLIDPQVFIDEERRKQERLAALRIKLKKFVAKRNVSFNIATVFRRWKEKTEKMIEHDKDNMGIIEQLRREIRKIDIKK